MMKAALLIPLLCLTFIVQGCTRRMDTESYREWLYSVDSGLTSSIDRGAYTFRMTLLPSEWRTAQMRDTSKLMKVLLTVSSQLSDAPDVSFEGINSLDDYAFRVEKLAFKVKGLVQLTVGNKTLKPLGTQMTHTQALKKSVSIYILFDVPEDVVAAEETVDIRFNDLIFGQGIMIHQFIPAKMLSVHPEVQG